jgi:hypothetical protein
MAPDSSRKRLPFEPAGKGKEADKPAPESAPSSGQASSPKAEAKAAAAKQTPTPKSTKVQSVQASTSKHGKPKPTASTAIPEAVSRRMLRRMLAFSGTPTALGVAVFFMSYFLIVKGGIMLPSYAVLLTTLGCFGLGVVGLTYGVLSASWDEDRPGGWLGLKEFKVNFGRMTSAWGSKSEN